MNLKQKFEEILAPFIDDDGAVASQLAGLAERELLAPASPTLRRMQVTTDGRVVYFHMFFVDGAGEPQAIFESPGGSVGVCHATWVEFLDPPKLQMNETDADALRRADHETRNVKGGKG